ncbi:CaiB/BaiF CoA transferase family protein [Rhizobium lentis]|uniref:Crotonobetainyl-CoA:carnitine CoA-transferase CaiB-like acyl-CoA transferase n=1 Tax=Rhizobium lentis TaxID=1138194 RepID=A0A7W8XJF8_9HYPH|nr:CaiB/BaiF CoA-transferase family protein [Rhizobium lentis]MBB4572988.1 crotonobetainyl-CoA:carnitine CoA-transferase CaiB-like acyl-CoA transferase [Rhizobium lentis]MBB5553416.1 crotonobetainyl-CoA:carnitine CoA-transferase CaiB-like acyl-CoA transferase [Rhizobium lentis]MBB5564018.1 crotonobetainyl-CoA:carnitine CoA-transferase CaiB-like acyl-CoA transferase [Rhizobium lentis]MBB5570430.1 crotonobetainyl-CoA:carnitine CoA-transferase CaiB-like acyl-CoA transferase [Rhizobium lentis]
MQSPLEGVRVLELARILAGPWAGQTLADLGATVIKVESPEGDDTRRWGPPFIRDGDDVAAAYFHSCNRGKLSITADFHAVEDVDKLRALVANADVVIENFKVGGLKKFGLDYESLKAINPRLIYCSITGFGQTGPYAGRAGYDFIVQGMAGIMDLTGEPDREPQKIGVAFADIFTGLYSVIAIQAALILRNTTGEGQFIDMALLDSAVGVLANQAMNFLASGKAPTRLGNAHPNIAPYQVFPVSDGNIIIACGNDAQFARLCDILRLSAVADDVRFKSNAERVRHREELTSVMEAQTKLFKRTDLLADLARVGIPAGPINTVEDVFADPQVAHRKMAVDNEGIAGIRTPIIFSGQALSSHRKSPRLGEHNGKVQADWTLLD